MAPRPLLLVPAALAALALPLAACSKDESSDSGSGAAGTTTELNVTVSEKGCEPSALEAEAGTVKVTVKNAGGGTGEFEIMQGDKVVAEKENLAPNFTATVTAKVQAGSYELICYEKDKPKGTLTVTGAAAG